MHHLVPQASRSWLLATVSLALTAMLFAASPSRAAQADTVTATGASGPVEPRIDTPFGPVTLFDIDVDAHSGISGQDPGGTAAFTFGVPALGGGLSFSGPVTCLSVTGPGQGGGTPTAPTTAVLRFQNSSGGLLMAVLVDNGGNGTDTMGFVQGMTPGPGCSVMQSITTPETGVLTNGRVVVFDAPPSPTSKTQCKGGGWQDFAQFKNQGSCVRFVGAGE